MSGLVRDGVLCDAVWASDCLKLTRQWNGMELNGNGDNFPCEYGFTFQVTRRVKVLFAFNRRFRDISPILHTDERNDRTVK